MKNYILADYKRIITRIPRLVILVLFQVVFFVFALHKYNSAAGTYTSVSLLETSTYFLSFWFIYILCLMDYIQTFSFDFRAKTIQVALGIGISRMKVIQSKLIQLTLVMLTDLAITLANFFLLTAIMGFSLAGHQLAYIFFSGLGSVLLVSCSTALLLPLIFRVPNMVLAMVGFFVMVTGLPGVFVRFVTRLGPAFLARMQLDQYTHESCVKLLETNAIQNMFQLWPLIGVILWYVIGIYVAWLVFRKMELDF